MLDEAIYSTSSASRSISKRIDHAGCVTALKGFLEEPAKSVEFVGAKEYGLCHVKVRRITHTMLRPWMACFYALISFLKLNR